MKYDISKLRNLLASDFLLFLDYCLQQEGFVPDKNQLIMADAAQQGHDIVCWFCARSFSKSWLLVRYAAWRLLRQPQLRILFVSGNPSRARKNVSQGLKPILDFDPVFSHLKPDKRSGTTCFNVNGAKQEGNAFSVDYTGIGSGRTGIHVDLILVDDLEQDEDMGSMARRTYLLEQTQKFEAWLNEPGLRYFNKPTIYEPEKTMLVVAGTYNCGRDSIYLPPEKEDEAHWLKGSHQVIIPALNKEGESNFPAIKSTEALLKKQDSLTSPYWYSQYMMDPLALDEELCPFREELIRKHSKELPVSHTIAVTDWSNGGDFFTCCFFAMYGGNFYLQDIVGWQKHTSDQSFRKLIPILQEHNVERLWVECNTRDEEKPDPVLTVAKRAMSDIGDPIGFYVPVEPVHQSSHGKKLHKILNLEPLLHTGMLIMNPKLLEHEQLMREIRGTRFNSEPKPHDDHIDVVATAIAEATKRGYIARTQYDESEIDDTVYFV